MEMDDLLGPHPQLGDGVDQLDQLMGRLPFQTQCVGGNRVEHQLPCVGVDADIAGGVPPVAVHGAVFNGQLHAPVFGALGQFGKDFLEPRNGRVDALAFQRAREGRHGLGPEEMSIVDGVFQVVQLGFVLQGVAVVADRGNIGARALQHPHHLGGQFLQVDAAVGHVEVDGKALKALVLHAGEPLLRLLSGNTGTDFDLFHNGSPCVWFDRDQSSFSSPFSK